MLAGFALLVLPAIPWLKGKRGAVGEMAEKG